MSRTRAWIYAIALAVVVVAADQVTKTLVERNLVIGEQVEVLGPIKLTNVGNTGIAFGLAGGGGKALVAMTLIALILILAVFARDPGRPGVWPAVGLLLGGAAGNLIDRIAHGAVTDFIKLPAWPSFNVADIAITCGVLLLAWTFIKTAGDEGEAEPQRGEGAG